jgi:hypothetical protein
MGSVFDPVTLDALAALAALDISKRVIEEAIKSSRRGLRPVTLVRPEKLMLEVFPAVLLIPSQPKRY